MVNIAEEYIISLQTETNYIVQLSSIVWTGSMQIKTESNSPPSFVSIMIVSIACTHHCLRSWCNRLQISCLFTWKPKCENNAQIIQILRYHFRLKLASRQDIWRALISDELLANDVFISREKALTLRTPLLNSSDILRTTQS